MTPLSVAVSICANAGTPTSRIRTTSVRTGLIRRVVGMVFPLPYCVAARHVCTALVVKKLLKRSFSYESQNCPRPMIHARELVLNMLRNQAELAYRPKVRIAHPRPTDGWEACRSMLQGSVSPYAPQRADLQAQ